MAHHRHAGLDDGTRRLHARGAATCTRAKVEGRQIGARLLQSPAPLLAHMCAAQCLRTQCVTTAMSAAKRRMHVRVC